MSALELSLGVAEKQQTSFLNTAFSSALHEGKRLDLHEPKFLLRRPREYLVIENVYENLTVLFLHSYIYSKYIKEAFVWFAETKREL